MMLDADLRVRLGTLDLHAHLRVESGEVVALLGPNGAGKTTLLRALAGLEPLSGGSVRLGGRVLESPGDGLRIAPEERRVGVVFQEYLLFPHLSALENVAFGARAIGVHRKAARESARQWLGRFGLGDAARARPSALSGGQRQRVALARALATEPGLLLLDEPLAALDAEARLAIRRELRAHLDAFEGPSVVVTHDAVEAAALADRLVVLEGGRVTHDGTIAEVTRHPRSTWAASLVGLNLYRGEGREDGLALEGGHRLAAATALRGEVIATVHPRAVALHRRRPEGSPRNVWQGNVDGLDVRGDHVRVHVDGSVPIVAEVTPTAVAELDLGSGGAVWVSIKASEVDAYPA